MASSQAQNCQRGTVFLVFLIILFFLLMVIVKLIKKLIDPIADDGGEAYKEGKEGEKKEEKKPKGEDSTLNLDDYAKQPPAVAEDDPPVIKLARKIEEVQFILFPIMIVFPLNLITGTAYAFLIVDFFFVIIPLILFNVLKLHKTFESKCLRVVLDNLWLFALWFMLLNQWGATPLRQPYIMIAG